MKEEMIFDIKVIANELHYHVSDNELKWRIFQLRVRLDKLEETVNRKGKGLSTSPFVLYVIVFEFGFTPTVYFR